MTSGDLRSAFPAVLEKTYLDTANLGLVALPVVEAVRDFMGTLTSAPRTTATDRYLALEAESDRARREVATLIGAGPDEVALVESTSHALQIVAAAIPLRPGDEVLYADWDFLGVPLSWYPLAEKGIRVSRVRLAAAADPVAALLAAVGPRTRVVCTSSVSEAAGVRLTLAPLAEACRRQDIWLVLDVVQEVGVCEMRLGEGVDIAACGGHKWLGCPFGAGFLYVARRRREELRPEHLGYLALEPPHGGWEDYLSSPSSVSPMRLRARRTASRLEIGGTPNFIGRFALAESCALLNRVGIGRVARDVSLLSGYLRGRLASAGLTVITPADPTRRAGIVCATLHDPARERWIVQALMDRSVLVSQRYTAGTGGLRASVHAYNTEQDVDRLAEALRDLL